MARRQPQFRIEDFEFNGKLFCSPAFSLQKAASLVRANVGAAPCDLTVVGLIFTVITTFTDASTVLSVGTYAAPTGKLASAVLTNLTGTIDYANSVTWTSKNFSYGDAMQVSLDNVAGTTGYGVGTLVCMPR